MRRLRDETTGAGVPALRPVLDEGRFYDMPALIASIRPVLATGRMTRNPVDVRAEVR